MNKWFYSLAPVILSVTGFAIIMSLHQVHDYLFYRQEWLFWLILFFVSVSSGVMMGMFIKKLHQRANKDSLTGLYNRRCFYDRLNYEIEKTKRTKLPLSLAVIDIDNFKTINDSFGHLEGDRVLKKLAEIFEKQARSADTIVRWGGEEFAMILPETDKEGALSFTERLRVLAEQLGFKYKVTISAGITTIYQGQDAEKAMSIADKALYKAKETKNKNVVIHLTE